MIGLLYSTDLMFSSRVTATAKNRGVEVRVVTTADRLLLDQDPEIRLVMIDLFRLPASEWSRVVSSLKEMESPPHVVAYGPHVDEEVLTAAREAGCDEVLTRGQFHQTMGDLMSRWLGGG